MHSQAGLAFALLLPAIALAGYIASTAARNQREEFIIGGTAAKAGQLPYQAAVQMHGTCGGALLNKQFVLTAAHCVHKVVTGVKVRLGSLKYNDGEKFEAEARTHPKFDFKGRGPYDIALLKLDRPVDYSTTVQPIALAREAVAAGTECVTAGWGLTENGTVSLNSLQYIEIPTVSDEECDREIKKFPGYNKFRADVMLCAGVISSKDACFGDSGGPLACDVNGKRQLVGLTSWGIDPDNKFDCALSYSVYAEVHAYLDWIDQTMAEMGE